MKKYIKWILIITIVSLYVFGIIAVARHDELILLGQIVFSVVLFALFADFILGHIALLLAMKFQWFDNVANVLAAAWMPLCFLSILALPYIFAANR